MLSSIIYYYAKEKPLDLSLFPEFHVFLCEELITLRKVLYLVAETLARSQSYARTEFCTIASDGMLPRMAADGIAQGPTVSFTLAAGSLVRRLHHG